MHSIDFDKFAVKSWLHRKFFSSGKTHVLHWKMCFTLEIPRYTTAFAWAFGLLLYAYKNDLIEKMHSINYGY